jgi:DNA repair photolyase
MELAVKEIKALPSKARIMVSSMTDPYQPIEETEKLTRGLLPVLASREDVQVILITKSDLVARDFNLISEFPNVKLCMTVTSLNSLEEFEPYAPSNGRRIMCLQVAHEQGIYTIASIEPWLPHVTEPLILVKMMCAYVDEFFIGSWNHHFRQGSEEEKKTMQIYKRQLPEVLEFLHNHMKKVVVKKELSEMTRG